MRQFRFYKETDNRWYIDLPEWKGAKADLEMVSGADRMLEYMAEGESEVEVYISEEHFAGAYFLDLLDEYPPGAGADYILRMYKGIEFNLQMWLCDVTKFVFNKFPVRIFIAPITK